MTLKKQSLFFCLFLTTYGFSQEPFYKIHTLGFHQTRAEEMRELNNRLYVVGMAMDTTIKPIERNLHISTFSLDGEPIKTLFWDKPGTKDEIMGHDWNTFQFYKDKVIVHYSSDQKRCTLAIDTTMEKITLLGCLPDENLFYSNNIIWKENELVILNRIQNREIILKTLLLDESDSYNTFNVTPVNNSDRFSSRKAFVLDNGNLALFGTVSNISGEVKDDFFDLFKIELNESYEIQSYDTFGKRLGTICDFSDWLIDSEGQLVTSSVRYDTTYYVENAGRKIKYPVIVKFDPTTLETKWETAPKGTESIRKHSYYNTIIETHDRDGYIAVGADYNDGPTDANFLIFTKISKEGDIVWSLKHEDKYIDDNTDLLVRDVIATSDGYYMACGIRSDGSHNDGIESRSQAFFIKFDEDGNLLNTSSTLMTAPQSGISIFPNPADELLNISLDEEAGSVNIKLTNMTGQLLLHHTDCIKTCKLDVSQLSSGSYIVLVSDSNDSLVFQKMVYID